MTGRFLIQLLIVFFNRKCILLAEGEIFEHGAQLPYSDLLHCTLAALSLQTKVAAGYTPARFNYPTNLR